MQNWTSLYLCIYTSILFGCKICTRTTGVSCGRFRRLFDLKLAQAIRDSYVLFTAWARTLVNHSATALRLRAGGGSATGGIEAGEMGDAGGGREEEEEEADGSELTVEELEEFQLLATKSLKMVRDEWNTRLASRLMCLCSVGRASNAAAEARRAGGAAKAAKHLYYCSTAAKSARVCQGGGCTKETGPYKTARTRGVCWCGICSHGEGKRRALHLCKSCNDNPEAHVTASKTAYGKKTPYRKVDWEGVPPT